MTCLPAGSHGLCFFYYFSFSFSLSLSKFLFDYSVAKSLFQWHFGRRNEIIFSIAVFFSSLSLHWCQAHAIRLILIAFYLLYDIDQLLIFVSWLTCFLCIFFGFISARKGKKRNFWSIFNKTESDIRCVCGTMQIADKALLFMLFHCK